MKGAAERKSASGFSAWPVAEGIVHRQVISPSWNSVSAERPGSVVQVPPVPVNPQPMSLGPDGNQYPDGGIDQLRIANALSPTADNLESSPCLYQAWNSRVTAWRYSALSSLRKKAVPLGCCSGTLLRCGYLLAWLGPSVITTSVVFQGSRLLMWVMMMVSKALEEQSPALLHSPGGRGKEERWFGDREDVQLRWSSQLKQCCSSERCKRKRRFVPSPPCPPQTALSPHQSSFCPPREAGLWRVKS